VNQISRRVIRGYFPFLGTADTLAGATS
jgi:hypothetical protein